VTGAARWDDDERGHGIGDARSHLPAIEELAELAARPDWVAEDPDKHLLPGLRQGADATGLTITSFAATPDGTFTVHVKGAGGMSRRQVRQAAWTLLGAIAEPVSYVREIHDKADTVFEVVTGNPESLRFATHGHSLKLVVDAAEPPP
jgi:hypothetical protein